MNLLLIEPGALASDGSADLTGAAAGHLRNVLRVGAGSRVRIGAIDGPRGVALVLEVSPERVRVQCVFEASPPERPAVDLLLALPRPKVLRRLWAQLAALGVGRILLANAARVDRQYFDTHVLGADCYRPLLIEGLQQAQDTRVPIVSIHRRLKVLIEDELDSLCPHAARLVTEPGSNSPLSEASRAVTEPRVLVAVGPEGGWNAYELALFQSNGFTCCGMGPRTLRSDTATIAILAIIHDAFARRSSDSLPIADR
jgi:RsmE family RNA methyltransferase